MTVRPILNWPDARLRQAAAPVAQVTDDTRVIWRDMVDTMEAMPGVGLAAPQIGVLQCLAVVDASQARGHAILMANPELLGASDDVVLDQEASPCLPGVFAQIPRHAAVSVRYRDHDGAVQERDFEGLWARSVQHQIDHLQGRMYFAHLSKTKRDMLLRRARKHR